MRIFWRRKIIETRRVEPTSVHFLRLLWPLVPPRRPSENWLLVIRRHPDEPYLEVEPLWLGPREREPRGTGCGAGLVCRTHARLKYFAGVMVCQQIAVKPSWRRQGVASEMLRRCCAQWTSPCGVELQGSYSSSGGPWAEEMQVRHGWRKR